MKAQSITPSTILLATAFKASATTEVPLGHKLVIPGDRPAAVVAFEGEVVAFFVSVAEMLSVPKSLAAIYGILFASPVPLTFSEIEARLDLSKGSVSQGLRALREIGAIKEVSMPADRTELFAPDTEMRQIIAHFLSSRVDDQLKSAKTRFKGFHAALGAFPSGEQKILKQRVKKLETWHGKASALVPLVRTFLKLAPSS